ncbi:MAG: hypothetical protein JXD18_00695 [Anaerolineae bacterium]|nr:hypothetical protein [Anaerolineae bacterium]
MLLALLAPLAIALLWGGVTADAAYRGFQSARAAAAGEVVRLPLTAVLLVPAARLGLPLPLVGAALSVLGWSGAVAAWFAVGRTLDRPAFAAAAALLLALHPLQPDALGLETGVLLGAVGGAALLAAHWSRTSLLAVVLGAAGYAFAGLLSGWWGDVRGTALVLAALQVLVAGGVTSLVVHLRSLVGLDGARRALWQATVVLGVAALAVGQGVALARAWTLRPVDRIALYHDAARWLQENTLPDETVATERPGLLGYLADRPTLSLSSAAGTTALLDALDRARPDVCLTLNSVGWQGVQRQPWFQARYAPVYYLPSVYDAAAPLTLFRYHPTPFDAGQTVSVTAVVDVETVGRVVLDAYRVAEPRLVPGAPLHVTSIWRAETPIAEPLTLRIQLRDGAGTVWTALEDTAPGGLATDLWNVGERYTSQHALALPLTLPVGDYALEAAFVRPNGSTASVGAVASLARPPLVTTSPPAPEVLLSVAFGDAIALVGYDAPARVAPGESLRVALYWHPLATIARDYKVFVHVLGPDGLPLAQDDSVPVGWTLPTTLWEPGTFIRDEHVLEIDPAVPRGDYALTVGLYDPQTGVRLPVSGGPVGDGYTILMRVQVR